MLSLGLSPSPQLVQDTNKELMISLGIQAFPTFRFYLEGRQVDETRGANIQEVAAKVRHVGSTVAAMRGQPKAVPLALPCTHRCGAVYRLFTPGRSRPRLRCGEQVARELCLCL